MRAGGTRPTRVTPHSSTAVQSFSSVSSSLHPMGRYNPYRDGGPRIHVRTTPVRCTQPSTPRAPIPVWARASSGLTSGRWLNFAGAGEIILRKLHTNICQYAGCTTPVGAWRPCGAPRTAPTATPAANDAHSGSSSSCISRSGGWDETTTHGVWDEEETIVPLGGCCNCTPMDRYE